MKAFILRVGRAIYKTIRTVFFLSVLFISVQLAQVEQLRLLCLEGKFKTELNQLIHQPENLPIPPISSFDHELLDPVNPVQGSDRGVLEIKPTPVAFVASNHLEKEQDPLQKYQQTKPWWRPLWLLKQPQEVMIQIYEDLFYPAVPLTLSGLIYATYGMLLGWLLWGCFVGLLRLLKQALFLAIRGSSKESTAVDENLSL